MRVICIHKGPWASMQDDLMGPGPAYMEECLVLRDWVEEFSTHQRYRMFLIKGWEDVWFKAHNFRPLPDIKELQALLNVSKPKVVDTVDA